MSTRIARTAARLTLTGCAAGLTLLAGGTAANASSTGSSVTMTASIRVGDQGVPGGSATFVRKLNPSGTETLSTDVNLVSASFGSHLCVAHSPFTTRSFASCPNNPKHAKHLTYTTDLGSAYRDQTVYIQLQVRLATSATRTQNGYAGWVAGTGGGDQFGNVSMGPATRPGTSPTPTATRPTTAVLGESFTAGGSGSAVAPTAVNAGSGGGAGTDPVRGVELALIAAAGVAVAGVSARRLVRGR